MNVVIGDLIDDGVSRTQKNEIEKGLCTALMFRIWGQAPCLAHAFLDR